jgi:hypothetical protein
MFPLFFYPRACPKRVETADLSATAVDVFVKTPTNRHPERPVTFSIFSCFLHIPLTKPVILSEALRRSIATEDLYGAESKDLGDVC